jgi:hypothetical protein
VYCGGKEAGITAVRSGGLVKTLHSSAAFCNNQIRVDHLVMILVDHLAGERLIGQVLRHMI